MKVVAVSGAARTCDVCLKSVVIGNLSNVQLYICPPGGDMESLLVSNLAEPNQTVINVND